MYSTILLRKWKEKHKFDKCLFNKLSESVFLLFAKNLEDLIVRALWSISLIQRHQLQLENHKLTCWYASLYNGIKRFAKLSTFRLQKKINKKLFPPDENFRTNMQVKWCKVIVRGFQKTIHLHTYHTIGSTKAFSKIKHPFTLLILFSTYNQMKWEIHRGSLCRIFLSYLSTTILQILSFYNIWVTPSWMVVDIFILLLTIEPQG